jgi:integrase
MRTTWHSQVAATAGSDHNFVALIQTVIALWLGHESPATTRIYLHGDMALKEQALSRLAPDGAPPAARASDPSPDEIAQ